MMEEYSINDTFHNQTPNISSVVGGLMPTSRTRNFFALRTHPARLGGLAPGDQQWCLLMLALIFARDCK